MRITDLTTNEALLAGGILGGFFALSAICTIIWVILLIIGWWKMFKKAGEKGWKSLIPIYNVYTAFKIAGMFPWWPVILFVASFIVNLIFSGVATEIDGSSVTIEASGSNIIGIVLTSAITILSLVLDIIWCFRLSKAFKRGVGTAILLIFFPNIMAMVLGFGSAKYDKKAKYGA